MSNFFQVSADFYAQFPTPIVRDNEGERLEKDLKEILRDSVFLSEAERKNLPRLLSFFGTKTLLALRDTLVRKNLRILIAKQQ